MSAEQINQFKSWIVASFLMFTTSMAFGQNISPLALQIRLEKTRNLFLKIDRETSNLKNRSQWSERLKVLENFQIEMNKSIETYIQGRRFQDLGQDPIFQQLLEIQTEVLVVQFPQPTDSLKEFEETCQDIRAGYLQSTPPQENQVRQSLGHQLAYALLVRICRPQ